MCVVLEDLRRRRKAVVRTVVKYTRLAPTMRLPPRQVLAGVAEEGHSKETTPIGRWLATVRSQDATFKSLQIPSCQWSEFYRLAR